MRSNRTKQIALSGLLAAVAVVIMGLGGLIPIATYACPMLCCLIQYTVLQFCGNKLAWTWYAVASILSVLLSPDKEAAMVFLAIGYYPLIKPILEKRKLGFLLKILFFNASILLIYGVMIYVMGMQEIAAENAEFGLIGLAVILLLGNITFCLLDRLLTVFSRKLR